MCDAVYYNTTFSQVQEKKSYKADVCQVRVHLEDVVSRPDISHVDPLAVNVMAIRIPASHCNALIPHVIAGISLVHACCQGDDKECVCGFFFFFLQPHQVIFLPKAYMDFPQTGLNSERHTLLNKKLVIKLKCFSHKANTV